MSTPLEKYLREEYTAKGKPVLVSGNIAIIGTDNDYEGGNLLLPLYKYLVTTTNNNPECLCAYLLNNNISKWSLSENNSWLNTCFKSGEINTFYIAHTKINTAIGNTNFVTEGEDRVNESWDHFNTAYTRVHNPRYKATYMEFINVINASFLRKQARVETWQVMGRV